VGPGSLGGVRPLHRNQLVVPPKDRVWGHDGGDLGEQAATECMALGCESSTLIISEAKSPIAELLLEHSILLNEVGNDLRLVAVGPSCEGGEEQLEREGIGQDLEILSLHRKGVSS